MSDKTKYEMVQDFHRSFSCPMADSPTPMNKEMVLNRLGFLAEEMIEILHVTSKTDFEFSEMLGELYLRMEDSYSKQLTKERSEDVLTGQFDGFLDIDYFNHGNYTILGVDPEVPYKLVHTANMNKLWEDGRPRYNELTGKIIKPPHWTAPDEAIKQEIQRQIKAAN